MAKAKNSRMEECIYLCWQCRDTCQDTLFNHVLGNGKAQENTTLICRLADCIQICQTAADFMRRNSPLHMATCAACAEVCDACADACAVMGKKDATIQACAEMCRHCADSCHQMGKMKHAA